MFAVRGFEVCLYTHTHTHKLDTYVSGGKWKGDRAIGRMGEAYSPIISSHLISKGINLLKNIFQSVLKLI